MKQVWICQGCGRAAVTEEGEVAPAACKNARCTWAGTGAQWRRVGNNAVDDSAPDPKPPVEIEGPPPAPPTAEEMKAAWCDGLAQALVIQHALAVLDGDFSVNDLWDLAERTFDEGNRRGLISTPH